MQTRMIHASFVLIIVLSVSVFLGPAMDAAAQQRPKNARPKAPVMIIRDTGGFAGPDLDFIVFPNLSWTLVAKREKSTGEISEQDLDGLIAKLKEAGVEEAKSIRPSPAPHSKIMIGRGRLNVNVFLNRDDALMATARELALDVKQ